MGKYRILSLDGGGIRGLMTAVWLDRLEKKMKVPLKECFDLVAGTSTGSLLACGISLGIPVETIVELYLDSGKEVFPSGLAKWNSRLVRTFSEGVSAPKYDGKGLERQLKKIFDGKLVGDLQIKPTLVFTYDTQNRQALVFKNTHSAHAKLHVWEICKASCSAPTYFPAHVMRIERAKVPLVDGGVVANNPTACAIAEAVKVNGGRPEKEKCDLAGFIVASFGTGEAIRPITAEDAREWGAIEWAVPIIDVLFDGSADAVDYIAKHILDENNYFRFQTRLDRAYDDMDNADATNLNALVNTANHYLSSQGGEALLDKLVKKLE